MGRKSRESPLVSKHRPRPYALCLHSPSVRVVLILVPLARVWARPLCVCVCMCVRERERESEVSVCVCVCV